MNNYLLGLPFEYNKSSSSDCKCSGQAFDPVSFKLYAETNKFPTFAIRLPPMGDNPDLTYANECLRVFTCDGKSMVSNLTMEQSGVRLFKDEASYYLIYEGGAVSGLKMECGKCYRLHILNMWSEPFWITDTPQSKVVLVFSSKSGLGDVPYQPPLNFQQRVMVDGEICNIDAEFFENKKTDANGVETVTFQRLTTRKKLTIYNVPSFIAELIGAIKLHTSYSVIHGGETLTPFPSRTVIENTIVNCCYTDIAITMPLRDINMTGGICQSDADAVLEEVDIPDDLPDSCETDDDWVDTEETLCLPFGQIPPPITPPITPVGTPPVGAPCPPDGFIVSQNTVNTSCSSPFIFEGVAYRSKIVKMIADGECGTTEQVTYVNPCTTESETHTISNVNCAGDVIPTPPVGTPPVGTPPVGTPPVGTPPVGTPPVGTPPPTGSNIFRHILGTTGSGFNKDATHGIDDSWVSRIEAYHYDWGWGITDISLWIPWDKYETAPGVFQTAALQRAIDFCNARALWLNVTFLGRRNEADGIIHEDEIVKGSAGHQYIEGVPGFGSIYAGYGCDRVNALMVPAIQSIANKLKTYSRAGYMALGGGHAGELVNHIIVVDGIWESGDFSDDNLARFNTWCTTRGIATPGTPPMIQGVGIPWPYPDFSQARGAEFGRFMTYNIAKYYRNFCNAVKAVAPGIPCINLYAAADNIQLRATANAAMDFIGQFGDGTYGSEGDGLYDHIAKIRCNSVNIGTFPTKLSFVEFDPDDLSTWRYSYGTTPPYCGANPQWATYEQSVLKLYQMGASGVHDAMAYCEGEIAGAKDVMQRLFQSCYGKPVSRPAINSTNTITCEVTGPYRNSQNILEFYGVDVNAKYAKYTSNDYWGGITPTF